MTKVRAQVEQQPGLMSFETLQDCDNPNKYIVLTNVSHVRFVAVANV